MKYKVRTTFSVHTLYGKYIVSDDLHPNVSCLPLVLSFFFVLSQPSKKLYIDKETCADMQILGMGHLYINNSKNILDKLKSKLQYVISMCDMENCVSRCCVIKAYQHIKHGEGDHEPLYPMERVSVINQNSAKNKSQ